MKGISFIVEDGGERVSQGKGKAKIKKRKKSLKGNYFSRKQSWEE